MGNLIETLGTLAHEISQGVPGHTLRVLRACLWVFTIFSLEALIGNNKKCENILSIYCAKIKIEYLLIYIYIFLMWNCRFNYYYNDTV